LQAFFSAAAAGVPLGFCRTRSPSQSALYFRDLFIFLVLATEALVPLHLRFHSILLFLFRDCKLLLECYSAAPSLISLLCPIWSFLCLRAFGTPISSTFVWLPLGTSARFAGASFFSASIPRALDSFATLVFFVRLQCCFATPRLRRCFSGVTRTVRLLPGFTSPYVAGLLNAAQAPLSQEEVK